MRIVYCRLSIKQKHSILYKGAKFWNALDQIFKNVNTPNSFKTKYKHFLISAY